MMIAASNDWVVHGYVDNDNNYIDVDVLKMKTMMSGWLKFSGIVQSDGDEWAIMDRWVNGLVVA